ncbi:TetR/AcrR family transcriptional regulator [Morganella morganii]|mgnify:FL=1|uniref:TetR/AcrR family transcriptional regulator n=1 Tax=Morganella morganii TaxID=582 RepID=UPI001299A80F|nr:TetR/AcrR family transcriptional regulator [Morganella morganii]MBT0382607.1 TetR/AcrR family transcriptional regulator [Morganella morganii subsp. morganii]MBT0421824.1 TetR/AcrR family transcriptional regulator [Morganella morganii subsp. morganii]MBT0516470.1 TetR/AcrR family transcriptional regulator [Morganella morganii subsp. morganii]MRE58119.1 TetR family transcriptional regulator [Morganella morganii]QWM02980.1 TetR/AcrR family transcriptional regulator [Morganella morganii subsp. 
MTQSAEHKPRFKPADVRINELMDAAESLFLEKGFDATTVSDIVARAGVAKGTYYHYFAAKPDIYEALRHRYMDWFLSQTQQAMDACAAGDADARLAAWCDRSVTAYTEKQELHDVLFHQGFHQQGNDHENAVLNQLLALIAEGEKHSHWQVAYPDITAMIIYHGMHAAVDTLPQSGHYTAQTLGGVLYEQFLRFLKA